MKFLHLVKLEVHSELGVCSSVVESLPSTHTGLGSISCLAKKRNKKYVVKKTVS
jgi:hypothetical protein